MDGNKQYLKTVLHVTWVGLWLNVCLAALKVVVGYLGNSRAVIADGIHSLSDMATDVAVLVGARFWAAPADDAHPYGHSRLEYLVTLGIALALCATGVVIAMESIFAYQKHLSAEEPYVRDAFTFMASGIAFVSIIVKEWLYRWTVRKGRQLKSSALIANAWHHRSDALSSIPAFAASGIAAIWPGLHIADVVGAVIVAVFIVGASWKIARPAIDALMDRGVNAETLRELVLRASGIPGVKGVHAVRTRTLGAGIQVDMHVMVDGGMSVKNGHAVASAVEKALRDKGPEVTDVLVHIEPWMPEHLHEE